MLFCRDQHQVEGIAGLALLRIMLCNEDLEPLSRDTDVYMGGTPCVRLWIITLKFVRSVTVREYSRPVVIIIIPMRTCKPEFYPRVLQRFAING